MQDKASRLKDKNTETTYLSTCLILSVSDAYHITNLQFILIQKKKLKLPVGNPKDMWPILVSWPNAGTTGSLLLI